MATFGHLGGGQARGKYIIDKSIMDVMRKDAIVMHPLPRLDEVSGLITQSTRLAASAICDL
eukprot:2723764-Pyramimonas_sp.AAC.1